MSRSRPTLGNGVIVFSCFILLLFTVGAAFPYQINHTDFIRRDSPVKYSEFEAANGALHTILGKDLMPILLGYAGYIKKMGA